MELKKVNLIGVKKQNLIIQRQKKGKFDWIKNLFGKSESEKKEDKK